MKEVEDKKYIARKNDVHANTQAQAQTSANISEQDKDAGKRRWVEGLQADLDREVKKRKKAYDDGRGDEGG